MFWLLARWLVSCYQTSALSGSLVFVNMFFGNIQTVYNLVLIQLKTVITNEQSSTIPPKGGE